MASSPPPSSMVPAQLGFLAIYNPSLGITDETIDDQIVYYASVTTLGSSGWRRRKTKPRPMDGASQEERNKRLRQIGLAQGMVEFGRSFSGDRPVDTVETEKSRVVLHELEPGWWILASIDLTRLPSPQTKGKPAAPASASGSGSTAANATVSAVEYSSREVKPAALLLQDLLRAHSLFLLHHDSSLSALFVRTKRAKFVALLTRYWDTVLSSWNVMLHGNPIGNIFGGIRVAASGELGIGVGEEERGSGEREVLEGLVGRIEGLVDLVVSKFGSYDPDTDMALDSQDPTAQPPLDQWLGTGAEPAAEDGAVFLGTGAISRRSLRDVTMWMEEIYSWGETAYGVRDSPTSTRRSRAHRKSVSTDQQQQQTVVLPPTPVTELVRRAKQPQQQQPAPSQAAGNKPRKKSTSTPSQPPDANHPSDQDSRGAGVNNFVDYLKLGYGKYWSIGGSSASGSEDRGDAPPPTSARRKSRRDSLTYNGDSAGQYLIGLMGDVEEPARNSDEDTDTGTGTGTDQDDHNSRTMLRTLVVELENDSALRKGAPPQDSSDSDEAVAGLEELDQAPFENRDRKKSKKLRVVVYVNRPFIFTFLFRLRTDSLAFDSLYKSLHHQLAPLRRPLANSTKYRPGKPDMGPAAATAAEVYDLVWDPRTLIIHSTIPSIPDPSPAASLTGGAPASSLGPPAAKPIWSRVEALNTHSQMLNMYLATRSDASELERTCKTSRGWWVVWNRITELEADAAAAAAADRGPKRGAASVARASSSDGGGDDDAGSDSGSSAGMSEETAKAPRSLRRTVCKEIFLVRKAGDHSGGGIAGGALRSLSASYAGAGAGAAGAGGTGWAEGASRLAQGIGVDTRKYIEGLLSLNR